MSTPFQSTAPAVHTAPPPGTVISHVNIKDTTFIGSPTLARLEDGTLIAAHDIFGPASAEHDLATTHVYSSPDEGATWNHISTIEGAFWSNLFVHDKALYLMGLTHHHGLLVIRRSCDGGKTWTHPGSATSGLITQYGQYHTAPMPMVLAHGRIWRSLEDATASTRWGKRYNPMIISAPVGADLLRRDSWRFSSLIRQDNSWLQNRFGGWLEGNLVMLPDGRMTDILRVDHPTRGLAACVTLEEDGNSLRFSPERDIIPFPGGATKFTIRQDPRDNTYWALSNAVTNDLVAAGTPQHTVRNTLALLHSNDACTWEARAVLIQHTDHRCHAFQYPDWIFDGDDILAVARTCWDDEFGGACNHHDANFMTFHRFEQFRKLKLTPEQAAQYREQ